MDREEWERMQRNDASEDFSTTLSEIEAEPVDPRHFGPSVLLKIFLRALKGDDQRLTAHKLVILTRLSKIAGRDLLETMGAQQQCAAAALQTPPSTTEKCWLCGFTLKEYTDVCKTLGINLAYAKPECEHLIPVSAALVYYGVYKSKKQNKAGVDYTSNYKWAHARCNRKKDDLTFLNFFSPDGTLLNGSRVTMNNGYINEFLDMIKDEPIKTLTKNRTDDWKNRRITSIQNDLGPLLGQINGRGRFSMITGAAEILDNIDDLYLTLKDKLNEGTIIRELDNTVILNLLNEQEKLYADKPTVLRFSKDVVDRLQIANVLADMSGTSRKKNRTLRKKKKRIHKKKTIKRSKHV